LIASYKDENFELVFKCFSIIRLLIQKKVLYLRAQNAKTKFNHNLKLGRKQAIAKQLTIRPQRGKVKEQPNRINDKIKGLKEVRLVGDNVEQGVYSYEEAIRIADQLELDLVEISPNAVPPVCKIVDYQKFLYQLKKREKEAKAKTAKVVLKEIRFGPQTDEHDYNFKLKHAIEFLKEGCKVKAYVFFKGRSILFKEQGEVLLLRFANELEDYAKVDQLPQLEGKRMIIMFSPKKAK
jgi:translation initiation factor IF-3